MSRARTNVLRCVAMSTAQAGARAGDVGVHYAGRRSALLQTDADDTQDRDCFWQPLQGEDHPRILSPVLGTGE